MTDRIKIKELIEKTNGLLGPKRLVANSFNYNRHIQDQIIEIQLEILKLLEKSI